MRKIYKNKRPEFSEHSTPRKLLEKSKESSANAIQIAKDWVTDMRLEHVMDQLTRNDSGEETEEKKISFVDILSAMVDDIKNESVGEIEFNVNIEREIKRQCAKLIKVRYNSIF